MKLIRSIIFLISLLVSANTIAQEEANVGCFGEYTGVDFNNVGPDALSDVVMNTAEVCSSISDSIGSLLFYTDGSTIWNKNHQVIDSGTGLLGSNSSYESL